MCIRDRSGCIPISIKLKRSNWRVESIDISEKCINLAKINAKKHSVKVNFQKRDILNIENWDNKLDYIISNPPYVAKFQKKDMDLNVLNYEPQSAIFVENNEQLKKVLEIKENYVKSRLEVKDFHKQPMGRDVGETYNPENPEWEYLPPNSVAENVLKQVCSR